MAVSIIKDRNLITQRIVKNNITVEANDVSEMVEIDVTLSGYAPLIATITIGNSTPSGANCSSCTVYYSIINGNTVNVRAKNNGDAQASIRFMADVLYQRL